METVGAVFHGMTNVGDIVETHIFDFCEDIYGLDIKIKFVRRLRDGRKFKSLDELKDHYRRGGLGDVKVKKFLFAVLNDFLTPIRERRAYYEEHIDEVIAAIKAGTEDARATAEQTLAEVKEAMQIDYFERWDREYK